MTTISDLVLNVDRFQNEERTPFASRPWHPTSEIIWKDGDGIAPIERDGLKFDYFLEPSIIQEIKEGLSSLEPEALVMRVMQYAEYDA